MFPINIPKTLPSEVGPFKCPAVHENQNKLDRDQAINQTRSLPGQLFTRKTPMQKSEYQITHLRNEHYWQEFVQLTRVHSSSLSKINGNMFAPGVVTP